MESLEQKTVFFLANQCKYLHPANSMKECLGVTGTLASARFLESPLWLRFALPPPKCALCGLGEGVPGAPWGALPKVVLKLRADPEREIGCWPWPPPPLTPRLSFICKLRENTICVKFAKSFFCACVLFCGPCSSHLIKPFIRSMKAGNIAYFAISKVSLVYYTLQHNPRLIGNVVFWIPKRHLWCRGEGTIWGQCFIDVFRDRMCNPMHPSTPSTQRWSILTPVYIFLPCRVAMAAFPSVSST